MSIDGRLTVCTHLSKTLSVFFFFFIGRFNTFRKVVRAGYKTLFLESFMFLEIRTLWLQIETFPKKLGLELEGSTSVFVGGHDSCPR